MLGFSRGLREGWTRKSFLPDCGHHKKNAFQGKKIGANSPTAPCRDFSEPFGIIGGGTPKKS